MLWLVGALICGAAGRDALAQSPPGKTNDADLPAYLADRGTGIATSMFGSYVEPGEKLLYPFYEYTRTSSFEYHASELGQVGEEDFLGHLTESELLLYFAYGVSDRLAFEVEGAYRTRATFDKALDDLTAVPATLTEEGLGDVEGQVRWRWRPETAEHGELFSYAELVLPTQPDKYLIGTANWEASIGFGWLRGHPWGTLGARVTVTYDRADPNAKLELGEYAIDYIKRLSPKWRWVGSLEGESDELSLIGEAQWFFAPRAFLKINSGFGLTPKAPDIAPEIGVMFHF